MKSHYSTQFSYIDHFSSTQILTVPKKIFLFFNMFRNKGAQKKKNKKIKIKKLHQNMIFFVILKNMRFAFTINPFFDQNLKSDQL